MKNKKVLRQNIYLLCVFLLELRTFCTKVLYIAPFLLLIEKIAFILLIIISLYNALTSRLKAKEIIIVVLLLILAGVSIVYTNSPNLSYLILLPFASKGIDFKKIVKTDLLSKIIITVFLFACYHLGLTESIVTLSRDGAIRESFGFAHPNTLGYVCVMSCLDMLYLMKGRVRSVTVRIAVTIIPFLLTLMANSRTAQIAIVVSVIFSIIETVYKKHKKQSKELCSRALRGLIYILPIILIAFSFVSTSAYARHEAWAVRLDDVLSRRLYLQDYYEKHHEKSLLGEELMNDYLIEKPLDNGYYRILVNNGILGLIALVIVVEISLKRSIKEKNGLIPTLILLLLYGLSEWTVFRVIVTPFWSIAFASDKERKKIKNEK